MTLTVDLDEQQVAEKPTQPQPTIGAWAKSWTRRHRTLAIATALLAAAALGAAAVTFRPVSTTPALPSVAWSVSGDAARAIVVVHYADGVEVVFAGQPEKVEGMQASAQYSGGIIKLRAAPTAVIISIDANAEAAGCEIVVDGIGQSAQTARTGGEMALCSWVANSSGSAVAVAGA